MYKLSACAFLCLLILIPSGQVLAQPTAEEAYLEKLLNARSLSKYMQQDVDAGLSELVNNPAPYLSLINDEPGFATRISPENYFESRLRTSRLIGLLESIGTEEARAMLENMYAVVVQDMEELLIAYELIWNSELDEETRLEASRDADAAYSLFLSLVYTFKRFEDDRILEDLISRYEGFNEVARLAVSNYSDVVGSGAIAESEVNAVMGWHMVGMPVEPFDSEYSAVYEGIVLDGTPWRWTSSGYETVTDLTMGEAYWVNALSEGSILVLGVENRSLTFPDLPAGWNNLAGPSCDYPVANLTTAYPEVNPDLIYEWQPVDGYVPVQEWEFIRQGNGIWVFLTSGATLTLSCPEGEAASSKAGPIVAAFKPGENGFRKISVTDNLSRSRTLYFGNTLPETIQSTFALPPVPPQGSFDVRFTDDKTLLQGAFEEMEITLSTDQYPVTITIDRGEGDGFIVDQMVGEEVISVQSLSVGDSVEISDPSVSTVRLRRE